MTHETDPASYQILNGTETMTMTPEYEADLIADIGETISNIQDQVSELEGHLLELGYWRCNSCNKLVKINEDQKARNATCETCEEASLVDWWGEWSVMIDKAMYRTLDHDFGPDRNWSSMPILN